MILITGVSGTVGRETSRCLPAGTAVRLLARDPSRIGAVPPGAEVVTADYADGPALLAVLRGVRAAFLVTTRVDGVDDERFLQAAAAAGVRHVVKLSAAAVEDPEAVDAITTWQRRSEEALRRSGLGWTFLRPRAFMSNTLSWASSIRSKGVVRMLDGDARNAVVDPRDIAAVAAKTLTEDGHIGRTYTLTGPKAVSPREQTEVLSAQLDSRLRFEELTAEQAFTAFCRRFPEAVAKALLESSARGRAGAKTRATDTIERLVGRPAAGYPELAADRLEAFSASAP